MQTGAALKNHGMDLVEMHNADFLVWIRAHARRISREKGAVSIDPLREIAAEYGVKPTSPNAWGCVFRDKELWAHVGYVRSRLSSNHAREVKKWKWLGN